MSRDSTPNGTAYQKKLKYVLKFDVGMCKPAGKLFRDKYGTKNASVIEHLIVHEWC